MKATLVNVVLTLSTFLLVVKCDFNVIQNEHEARKYLQEYNSVSTQEKDDFQYLWGHILGPKDDDVHAIIAGIDTLYHQYLDVIHNDTNQTAQCVQDSYDVIMDFIAGKMYAIQSKWNFQNKQLYVNENMFKKLL